MAETKNTFKELTLKQKIQYLWDYYRTPAIVTILLIIVAVTLIKTVSFNHVKYDAYCLILNDSNNEDIVSRIQEGFPAFLDNDAYKISIDNGYVFSYLEEYGLSWPDQSAVTKITSLVGTNKADMAIADYETMLWAVHTQYIYSLDDILPKDLLEKLKPYWVYAYFKGEITCDGKIYGLNIADTEVYKGHSDNYENAVVFIPNLEVEPNEKVSHETAIQFIKYLYNIK